ncbi:MAG: DNA polymerase III subunit gamma/tau [Planctomycetota bacterium]
MGGAPEEPRPGTAYRVLARRFRPTSFGEMVGQEAVLDALRSALATGRIPHAVMLSGSRGVGKTTLARIFARCLNCAQGPTADPCGECDLCVSILRGSCADVVEIDAASHNLVDDVRELRERVAFASMGARYKVYILDEVHMLTRSAFNAFLKTLEEPPPGVVFIMATTELHKVPETIRSRCQVHLLGRIGESDIAARLAAICGHEGVALAPEILDEIAAQCRGGMRDAETALERLLPLARESADGSLSLEEYQRFAHRTGVDALIDVVAQLLEGQAAPALRFAAAVVDAGADERETMAELLEVLRGLLLLQVDGPDSGLVRYSGAVRTRLVELAAAADRLRVEAMIQAGLLGRERLRRLEDHRLVLELTLLRMAEAGTLPQLGELLAAARSGAPLRDPATGTAAPPAPAAAGNEAQASAPGRAPAAPKSPVPAPAQAPALASSAPAPARATPAPTRAGSAPAASDLCSGLIARVRAAAPLLARTLEQVNVEGPDEQGEVRLTLRSERKLHRERLASKGVQQQLRTALTELVGRPVTVALTPAGDAPAAAPPDPLAASAAVTPPSSSPPPASAPPASPAPAATPPPDPPPAATPAPEPDATEPPPKKSAAKRASPPGAAARKVAERFDGQFVDSDDSEQP